MQRRSRKMMAALSIPLVGALALGAAAARTPAPQESALVMEASVSARTLTVSRNGEVIKTYPVAVGTPKYPTPRGNFGVSKVVWNPAWVPPDSRWARGKTAKAPGAKDNPMKLVKIFFKEPDYYIHGTAAISSLGEAASHGCLRMDPDDAGELALMVMENAGVARDWDWVKGILNLGEQRTVRLQQAAPLRVTS